MTFNPRSSSLSGQSTSAEAWHLLEKKLTESLADLAEDEFLVTAREGTDYFVQFAGQGAWGMRIEASSNAYHSPCFQLPDTALGHLASLGWNLPTYVQAEMVTEPCDGSPNFFIDARRPVQYEALARVAVRTLREVYGAKDPSDLVYRGYSWGYTSIRFSQLGIRRFDSLEEQYATILREMEPELVPAVQLPVMMPVEVC